MLPSSDLVYFLRKFDNDGEDGRSMGGYGIGGVEGKVKGLGRRVSGSGSI